MKASKIIYAVGAGVAIWFLFFRKTAAGNAQNATQSPDPSTSSLTPGDNPFLFG